MVDRLVQQAILQALNPLIDPTFSESSFGFRPGRSAHDALEQASRHVAEGRSIVVDCDLEKFFDRVNHGKQVPVPDRKIAFTVKLSENLTEQLRQYARFQGQSISKVVTEALIAFLQEGWRHGQAEENGKNH